MVVTLCGLCPKVFLSAIAPAATVLLWLGKDHEAGA